MPVKYEPILPGAFKESAFDDEIEKALRLFNEGVAQDFDKTVRTWEKKPDFEREIKLGKGRKEASVTTENEVYGYVDEGTPPHVIRAKGGGMLVFNVPSSPKTTPNVIGSSQGSRGDTTVYAQEVNHPGTKARNFSITIKKKWEPRFGRMMQEAYYRGADKSGHGI